MYITCGDPSAKRTYANTRTTIYTEPPTTIWPRHKFYNFAENPSLSLLELIY